MSAQPSQGATNERVTFRTYRAFVAKLRLIAEAYDLRAGDRLSIGAALNKIIGEYDAAAAEKLVKQKQRKTKEK